MGKYNKEIRLRNKKTIVWTIFLSVIVLLPNIFLAFYGNYIAEASFFKLIIFLIVSVLLFLLPSLFIKKRTFFLLYGVFVLLAPFEIVHVYLNRMPVTTAYLLSIFDTSWNESTEMLTSLKIPILFLLIF
jgi:glucan phosphoethanolaminetransferase (alkaline phosphatase superfamily)